MSSLTKRVTSSARESISNDDRIKIADIQVYMLPKGLSVEGHILKLVFNEEQGDKLAEYINEMYRESMNRISDSYECSESENSSYSA